MKKRILSMAIALSMVAAFMPTLASAETEGKYGEYLYYEVEKYAGGDSFVIITDCDNKATEIEIPSKIDGVSVTQIRTLAFYGCSSLQSITIPNSVTYIGDWAFYGCKSLQSITIPDSVTDIGDRAFEGCSSLQSITIPDSVTQIDNQTFEGCSSLQSVTIPNSVTDIGGRAFYGCSSLQSIIIPDSVTDIGDSAFEGCKSLQSIIIPDSVTDIGDWAFAYCESMQSINVDEENEDYCSVDGVLFDKDKTVLIKYPQGKEDTSYIVPDSVTSIVSGAFEFCHSLQSITIPNSVTEIGNEAFMGCSSLQSITIPNSVTYIGDRAFEDCSSLQSITIPNSVTYIGDGTFAYCESMQSINVDEENENYCSVDGVLFDKDKTRLVKYPQDKKDTSYIVPDSVTRIGNGAFEFCHSLQSIIIPDSVKYIYDAFCGCSLQSINVDEENENYCSVDGVLFNKGKTRLVQYPQDKKDTSYIVPDSVTRIGNGAFAFCSSLQSITIPDSVTQIGYCAFAYCESLQSITIPSSVTHINYYAFNNCDNLTDVYYAGTEAMWNNIDINSGNNYLLNATIHYNYIDTTPDVYEISAVTPTETGVEFTVTTNENVSGTQAVMVVCYDENGAFIGLKQEEITASDEMQTIEVDIDKANAESVKVFIWNRLEYMMPASNAQSLELE